MATPNPKANHKKQVQKIDSNPFALHLKGQDGSQTVCVGNLHVLLSQKDGAWLAQGLEIDYAIDGNSVEDVKNRFVEGLTLTIESHLRVYGEIKSLLRVAPQPIWDRFYAAVPPDVQHKTRVLTVHKFKTPQQTLPFGQIVYAQEALAA